MCLRGLKEHCNLLWDLGDENRCPILLLLAFLVFLLRVCFPHLLVIQASSVAQEAQGNRRRNRLTARSGLVEESLSIGGIQRVTRATS
jgi:hypothetical protein